MSDHPSEPASTITPPAIRAVCQPSRGGREMAALFALLTPQEARLLGLLLGLLLLGLSVRFIHLRLEQSRVLPVETRTVQPARSHSP